MTAPTLLQLTLYIPLCGGLLLLVSRKSPGLQSAINLLTALLLAASVIGLWLKAPQGVHQWRLAEPFPGLPLVLQTEPLGLLFAVVASVMWVPTALYTSGYMAANHEKHTTRMLFLFAVSLASAMLIAFSGNLLTLFLGYEALTLATYPLVTHKGSLEAMQAGRVYLGILMASSIGLLLVGILWVWQLAGSTSFVPGGILPQGLGPIAGGLLFALFLFGTAKAALMPLHRWLPAAMIAPTPVSALLHAVAVVKAGVFTVLKVSCYTFGPQWLLHIGSHRWTIYLVCFTLVAASVVALYQDNLKKRLAYSTISQLSYILLGTVMLTPASLLAAALHIAFHACGKITLFFAAGAIHTAAHKDKISQLDGIGRRMPWTMGAFSLASLSMIGLPPTAGFISKWYLLEGAMSSHNLFVALVLLISTLLNAGYFVPIIYRAFARPLPQSPKHRSHGEAPWTLVLPLCLTATLTVVLFCWPQPLLELAHRFTGGLP